MERMWAGRKPVDCSVLGSGAKSGYSFAFAGGTNTWTCTATPTGDGNSGDRRFFVDQSGVIRAVGSGTASVTSPPID